MKPTALFLVFLILFSGSAVTGDTAKPGPETPVEKDRPSGPHGSSSEHLVQPVSSEPLPADSGAVNSAPDESGVGTQDETGSLSEPLSPEPLEADPADRQDTGTSTVGMEAGTAAGVTAPEAVVPEQPSPQPAESADSSTAVTPEPESVEPSAAESAAPDSAAAADGTAASEPGSAVPSASAAPAEPAALPVPDPAGGVTYPEPTAMPVPPGESIIRYNTVFSYYGHPNTVRMGILGEHPLDELHELMKRAAAPYDALNGERGVVLALHLIYGTVWPEGEIGILNRENLLRHIEFARERGMLIFIDHQLGKYSVTEAVTLMLPYLAYDNVHLAIDPEWHTVRPGKELGHITAEDLNAAQELMERYLEEHGIAGKKMLMVHQFNPTMIRNRELVRSDFPRIDLIHNADGFGNTGQKLSSYRHIAEAKNMPNKGFKLFYPTKLRDWGWDKPLMTPEEVLKLSPQPVLVMYQ